MKKSLITSIILSIISVCAFAQGNDIEKLWKNFEEAAGADRPKDAINILNSIKKEAKKETRVWDYYKACDKECSMRSNINWKDRDQARKNFEDQLVEFGDATALFFFRRFSDPDTLFKYIKENESGLKKSFNPEFYRQDNLAFSYPYGEALVEFLNNDYQYAQWSLYKRTGKVQYLEETQVGQYPYDAFVEYDSIRKLPEAERADKLDAFSLKYEEKAVGLMAQEDIIAIRFDELEESNGNSEQFKDLRSDCISIENAKRKFSGNEKTLADCMKQAVRIKERLDSKEIRCGVDNDTLWIGVRNVVAVNISILSGSKAIMQFQAKNSSNSYYRRDSILVFIPTHLNDGNYTIVCSDGKTEGRTVWEKYTLSAAVKNDSEGFWAYVTDYCTGKPIKGYENGFVKTDSKEFQATLKEGNRIRKSKPVLCYVPNTVSEQTEPAFNTIICDRKAFRPEDTVQFKVFHSQGGRAVVFLQNAESRDIDSLTLTFNDFGTAEGSFRIRRQALNGSFRILAKSEGKTFASTDIRVDDFKLPSFEITFEKPNRIFLPEDTAVIKGQIKSFSGHNLNSARAEFAVSQYFDSEVQQGQLKFDKAGRFSVSFTIPQKGQGRYNVKVKVTDGTGEVVENAYSFTTFSPTIGIEVKNRLKGKVDGNESVAIITNKTAKVQFLAANHPKHKVHYKFSKGNITLSEGYADNGRIVNLKTEAPGLYMISTEFADTKAQFSILKVSENSATAPAGVKCFFREIDDGRIAVQAGYSGKEVWTVAELYSPDDRLLARRIYDKGGLIDFLYKVEYPDAVKLNILSFFEGESFNYSIKRQRYSDNLHLPLSLSRYVDKSSPDTKVSYVISTDADVECAASVYDKSTNSIANNVWKGFKSADPESSVTYYFAEGCNASVNLYYGRVTGYAKSNSEDMLSADGISDEENNTVHLRSDFASTLLWEPMLRSDSEGRIPLEFKTSDKPGTFIIQLLAHDRNFRNSVMSKELTVYLPVEVSIQQPAFLYSNDRYVLSGVISNSSEYEVTGEACFDVCNGRFRKKESISVAAGDSEKFQFEIKVPEVDSLPVVFSFISKGRSDAMKVIIPVKKPFQTIVETASALLKDGQNKAELIKELKGKLVNTDSLYATVSEISIKDMLEKAESTVFKPGNNDIVSLTSTLWQSADYLDRIMACHNADGGFAWFAGMESSLILTALVLERMQLQPQVFESIIEETVHYFDREYFKDPEKATWRGGISMELYLYIRSLYKNISFNEIPSREWEKASRQYLSGKKGTIPEGYILGKARRILTNLNTGKYAASVKKDLASLKQYAVSHSSGGHYFPNAVMPFRGLMETELYAHTTLCNLFDKTGNKELAEGIRLWIMVQKETQDWSNDPALSDAVKAVNAGSEQTLATKVLYVRSEKELPFNQIKSSSNGISLNCSYSVPEDRNLRTGDRIKAVYEIRSDENRSFVVLSVPRCAGLTPVSQLSGRESQTVYRNVLVDRIEYWFEVLPEEKTVIEEEFFVTQSGDFQIPAASIECRYAPHYRASDTTKVLPPM